MPFTAYRLVHSDHDPISVGGALTRPSDNSNQKNGQGMYFGRTSAGAIAFSKSNGGQLHKYDHLLDVELPFATEQFYDESSAPNALTQWWTAQLTTNTITREEYTKAARKEKVERYCHAHDLVGVFWKDEVLVLTKHIGAGFKIMAVTKL